MDERLGTSPPATGVLGDYIFERLLDSLELNVVQFLDLVVMLHIPMQKQVIPRECHSTTAAKTSRDGADDLCPYLSD